MALLLVGKGWRITVKLGRFLYERGSVFVAATWVTLCCVFTFSGTDAMGEEPDDPAVVRAATEGLAFYGGKLEEKKVFYGLDADLDTSELTLGKPFQLQVLLPQWFLNWEDGRSLDDVSQPSGSWIFPVKIGGKVKLVLWVTDRGNGEWRPGAFGMAPLAATLGRLRAKFEAANADEDGRLVLYTTPGAPAYYFTTSAVDYPNLSSLADDFSGEDFKPTEFDEMAKKLRAFFEKSAKQ